MDYFIINNQGAAALSFLIYYPLRDYSTYFGCSLLPSSGVHKTVGAIIGTRHVSVWFRFKSVKRCPTSGAYLTMSWANLAMT